MNEIQWYICDECNGAGCRYCRYKGEIRENEDALRELEDQDRADYMIDIRKDDHL